MFWLYSNLRVSHFKKPKHRVELSPSRRLKKKVLNIMWSRFSFIKTLEYDPLNIIISLLQYSRTEKDHEGLLSLKEILNKDILFINPVNKYFYTFIILVNLYSYSTFFRGFSKYSVYHFCSKIFIQWINITVQSVF